MVIRLNQPGYDHAKALIAAGKCVVDDRDDWSEHQPTAKQENAFIEEHGLHEYTHWYLGIDDSEDADNKGRYKFPYGDFKKVHHCGVLAAESRAGQYKHADIEAAAAHLHGMLQGRS